MSVEENKALVRRYAEDLWTTGNLDVVDEILGAPYAADPEKFKSTLQKMRKGYPDIHRTIVDMVAEGDKVVLYSTFTGTHTEEGSNGFAATGEAVEMTGVATFVIKDSKIVDEPWSCWNKAAREQKVAKAAIRLFVEKVWNRGDLETADQYIAPDYVRHDPAASEDVQGIDGFKGIVAIYRTAFPDLHLHIEDIIVGGNKGETVALRWSGTGTHQGELMGVAPTGKQVNSSGNTFLRLENGKISEEWVQWDNLGLLQQVEG